MESILLFLAIVLIILSLLQSGKSDGINGAFTGGDGLNLFKNVKERGAEKVLARITMGVGLIFLVVALFIQHV